MYVKLNWDAFFSPTESKDCMDSAWYEHGHMLTIRGEQLFLSHWDADNLLESLPREDYENVVD